VEEVREESLAAEAVAELAVQLLFVNRLVQAYFEPVLAQLVYT